MGVKECFGGGWKFLADPFGGKYGRALDRPGARNDNPWQHSQRPMVIKRTFCC